MFGPWGNVLNNEGDGEEDVDVSEEDKEEEAGKRRSNEIIDCFGIGAHVGYGVASLGSKRRGGGRRWGGNGVRAKWNAWEVEGWRETPPGGRLRGRWGFSQRAGFAAWVVDEGEDGDDDCFLRILSIAFSRCCD